MGTITRKQYLDKDATHREYYGQFVTDATVYAVVASIGAEDILASEDRAFNDISLERWDRCIGYCGSSTPPPGGSFRIVGLPVAVRFRDVGDLPSIAGWTCVAKEAARQYKEGQF